MSRMRLHECYTAHTISSGVSRRGSEAGIKGVSIHQIRRVVSFYLNEPLTPSPRSILGAQKKESDIRFPFLVARGGLEPSTPRV